jgi:F420-non-reducing hydrogenase small subunit
MGQKPKLSMYWASSCGGCEISLVNTHEKILDVDAAFDFMFCPCLLDTKKAAIEELPDKDIAVTFFNGAIRTAENEEMAHLLRRKSRILIAFGSCACEGCIPGLANLSSRKELFDSVYLKNTSTPNTAGVVPLTEVTVAEGTLTIPEFLQEAKTLAQVTDVDYFLPGCPPEPQQIINVIDLLLSGEPLPQRGAVVGAGRSTVCEECKRTKENKVVSQFHRTYEIIPDRERCLLEQGILCMGLATRDGCGALCPTVNMPCIGCYGKPEGTSDQGARMIAALGSMIDIGGAKSIHEDAIAAHVDRIIDDIPDLAGTFYKASLPGSTLKGKRA